MSGPIVTTAPAPVDLETETAPRFDVIVVGAGPAGLSAALILARCRRSVLVCDTGRPRNAASHALHGFLSRDGIDPADLRRTAREQLAAYSDVEVRSVEVVGARRSETGFEVALATGERIVCRRLLLATGLVDEIPDIPGMREFLGRGVFTCPYCDGWEVRDKPLAVYGQGRRGVGLALELTLWSRDVLLCTDGQPGLSGGDRERLARHGVWLREEPIAELGGGDEGLDHIRFASGGLVPRRALFLAVEQRQHSALPAALGCVLTERGVVGTSEYEATTVPGLFVAGDASRRVELSIVAAAEGALAAFAINTALLREDLSGWVASGCCGGSVPSMNSGDTPRQHESDGAS